MEKEGVIPDIVIEPHPDQLARGIDVQLDRAVEVLARGGGGVAEDAAMPVKAERRRGGEPVHVRARRCASRERGRRSGGICSAGSGPPCTPSPSSAKPQAAERGEMRSGVGCILAKLFLTTLDKAGDVDHLESTQHYITHRDRCRRGATADFAVLSIAARTSARRRTSPDWARVNSAKLSPNIVRSVEARAAVEIDAGTVTHLLRKTRKSVRARPPILGALGMIGSDRAINACRRRPCLHDEDPDRPATHSSDALWAIGQRADTPENNQELLPGSCN